MDEDSDEVDELLSLATAADQPEAQGPINWDALTASEASYEWLRLDAWVTWLRVTYGLVPTIIPPLWHRHPELVWELSALHLHWVASYDPEQHASSAVQWHQAFESACQRLRAWVALSGTKLDRDRPTQPAQWPGDPPAETSTDTAITDRYQDFTDFVRADIWQRIEAEDHQPDRGDDPEEAEHPHAIDTTQGPGS